MALDEEQKSQRNSRIEQLLLNDFHGDFQDYYSIVIATCGLHPEQLNNELRNMLTHVARALAADSMNEWESQIQQAENHLERASRDCVKLANLQIFKELKRDSFYIQMRDGTGALGVRRRLIDIEDRLKAARRIELSGEDATLESLLDINVMLQELRAECEKVFVSPGWNLSRIGRFKLWLSFNWQSTATGVLIGLLTNLIWLFVD